MMIGRPTAIDLSQPLLELATRLDAWVKFKSPIDEYREIVQAIRELSRGAMFLWDDIDKEIIYPKMFNEPPTIEAPPIYRD